MYRYAKRRYGEVPEPFAVVAHHRRLLIANAVHETMVERRPRRCPPVCVSWRCFGPRARSAARGASTSDPCCNGWTASTWSG